MSALRKALGRHAIATVAGRGYRFTPEIRHVAEATRGGSAAHSLPHPLTSFVGREDDLATIAQAFRQTRLVTLTGIGGCGKTRLAISFSC